MKKAGSMTVVCRMTKSYIRTDEEEEETPVYGISFFKTGSSERAIRNFSDVFLSEDEAAEFCAGINENDLDEIHIDEIVQDAVNTISYV